MVQRLIVTVEKCTECRACELTCSLEHFGVFNPRKSGVRIVSNWPELARARVCIQCEEPECLPACPAEALVVTESGSITVLHELCTGCESCVDACPYDGIWMDPLSGLAVKCDTCDGQFACLAVCTAGALSIGE
ncbi:MAG: 4Fe-4S dicluster domain-containing protein [Anaerolineae bacterium]|jgi:carbon-monoxide dehydrogenase iron sulfur subunit